MTRPHATIECNTFACTTEGDEENDNTDVRVITLRFDMDYTTVMDDADISKTFEKSLIEDTMRKHKGSINKVMEELLIPRRTLNEKMSKYSLNRSNFLE